MSSFHALIPCTSLSTPNTTAKSLQQLSTFNNGIGSYLFSCHSHKIRGGCKFSWNFTKRFNLYASLSSNGNGLEAAAAASKEFEDDEFIVVNFYRFVFIKDPEEEVSKHLHFMKDRNIHGRIYLNEQGINAQYSGPSKDALSYVEWVKEDPRFSEILVQVSQATSGHAFPKLKLRYKPSLVQASSKYIGLILVNSRTLYHSSSKLHRWKQPLSLSLTHTQCFSRRAISSPCLHFAIVVY